MWFDLEETVAAVLAILRLAGGDIDEPRLRALVPTAADAIEKRCDRIDPMPNTSDEPMLQEALQLVTLEMYRQPASVAQLVGLTSAVATGVFDPVAPAEPLIQPYHQNWAVA
jgi:hypothetical protein